MIPTTTTPPIPQSPPAEPAADALAGFNVLLMGPAGTGKTHSLGTLVDADPNLHVHVLFLESGAESLMGYWRDRGLEIPKNLSWHTLAAPKASFKEMLDSAKQINMLSLDALAKMQDPNRSKHNSFIHFLEALNDPVDDRTGRKLGAVDTWGTNHALAVDGMTGIGRAAMSLVIGGKPVRSQSDWGIAQDQVEKTLRSLTDGCRCHFILLSHVEREVDQVLGGTKLFVSTLGKALTPRIAPMFSDVILTVREGTKWSWDTSNPMADVKGRNLPFKAGQAPDFRPILDKWKARGGVVA
jgi:hypothetical protein